MPIDELISRLLNASIFLTLLGAFAALLILCVQIFAIVVAVRFLFFVWRSLGLLEGTVHEASIKQRGLWGTNSQKELDDFHQTQALRWRSAVRVAYVLCLISPIVAAFFALGQPVAWLLLLVEGALVIFEGIVIAFN
jgi:hypothetical protein